MISRSLVQALAYYYMRILVFRPAVSSSLGPKAAPALLSVSEASKHMIQIVQLLEERSMSFSFCLNKSDMLILCGMALLYQTVGLKQDSKVLKDNERLANAVIKIVEKAKAPGSYDFKRVAGLLVTVDEPPPHTLPTPPSNSPDACIVAPPTLRTSPPAPLVPQRMQHTIGVRVNASVSETDLLLQQEKLRRMTMPPAAPQHGAEQYRARSRQSFDGASRHASPMARRDHRLSLSQVQAAQAAMMARASPGSGAAPKQNLDFLSLNASPQSQPSSPVQARGQHVLQPQFHAQLLLQKPAVSPAEWDALLGSIENGQMNLYDAIYGGPGSIALTETSSSWSPEPWDISGFNLGDFGPGSATTHSVLSLSEDSLSSGDDLAPGEMGLGLDFGAPMLPVTTACGTTDGFVLEGLEGFL